MKNALKKSAYREILSTKSRFFAIFGIVAIGVGFFSGVKASAPDMRLTSDAYFDKNELADFRIVSTYGFNDNDIAALGELSGAQVIPSYYTDVLAVREGGSPSPARVFALGDGSVNKLTVLEGRMPERPDECVAVGTGMKNTIEIGSAVSFTDGDGEEPSDMLDRYVYTVTGVVTTPVYIDKSSFGSTNIGNGSIASVYYIRDENFCVEYNTEVYLRYPELKELLSYGSDYKDRIDELKKQVEAVADRREKERYTEVTDEANEKLDDAKKELSDAEKEADEKIADGEKELADAKRKLSDAQADIDDAEKKISDGEKELADARQKIDDGYDELAQSRKDYDEQIAEAKQELADAETEIKDSEKKLADGEKEYADGLKEYNESLDKYNDGVKQYEDGLKKYQDGLKQYQDGLSAWEENKEQLDIGLELLEAGKDEQKQGEEQLAASKAELDAALLQLEQLKAMAGENDPRYIAAKAQYDAGMTEYTEGAAKLEQAALIIAGTEAELAAGEEQLNAAKEELDKAKAELDEAKKTLDESKAELDDAKKQLDDGKKDLDDARKELDDGKKQLEDGKKEYEDGLKELEDKMAEAEREFADAEKELADAEKEYEDGKEELADARQKLEDGKADYAQGLIDYADGEKKLNDGKAEADEKISDAKKELADAEKKIADLDEPEWYVFTRGDNVGYTEYDENSDRIDKIASVFPIFFILVAMLVCLTTMSRMVDEQRVQIGTLKALGYSNGKIIYKYMLYAALATVTGSLFGALAGMKIFPFVIITAYGMMYAIPELVLPINIPIGIISIAVSLLAILGTVFFSCRSALMEQTAQLMRPKPPKNGKRILLEHVGFIWKRFNFSSKVTARNLFRYKRKMLMSTIGIAGCTALLLTGFSLYDSINDVIVKQYGELQSYDGIAIYDSKKYPDSDDEAAALIASLSESSGSVNVFQKQMDVEKGGKSVSAYVAVPHQADIFTSFLNLRDRKTGNKFGLTDGTVYMDEKMTLLLNAKAGDTLTISKSDTEKVNVTLTAPFENYPNHYVYMTESTYKDLFGEEPEYNTIYFRHGLNEDNEDGIAERLLDIDGVLTVSFSTNVQSTFKSMLQALDFVIVVIIACAGLLAFIVMYNLTNININERIREIATLKVLGFYDMEVDAYIFRENILLTLLGTAAGLILGVFLANFIITTAEVDFVMFGRNIYAMSYVLAGLITLAFSLLVTLVMHSRLKKVNMIEALKSVE